MRIRNILSIARDEEGAVTVELAFSAVLMAALLLPLYDLATGIYNNIQLTSASRAGFYYAYANPEDTDGITQAITNAGNMEEVHIDYSQSCECYGNTSSCEAQCPNGTARYLTINLSYQQPLMMNYPQVGQNYTLTKTISLRTQ